MDCPQSGVEYPLHFADVGTTVVLAEANFLLYLSR